VLLNTLAGGLVALGGGGGHGTLPVLDNTSGSPVYTALNSFLPTYDSTPASKPKAYLNWMLLDNQFNYVSGNNQSGAIPVGSANVLNTLATTIKLKHSGYLYIWVSNETQGWDVFFDNFSVYYKQGPVLEENHYYPFGLMMAGISDKALKTQYAQNKYRYNGKEFENHEFSDGTGLEEYDFGARFQDPQLGMWHGIDPLADKSRRWSPYAFACNSPLRFVDPDGMEDNDVYLPKENFLDQFQMAIPGQNYILIDANGRVINEIGSSGTEGGGNGGNENSNTDDQDNSTGDQTFIHDLVNDIEDSRYGDAVNRIIDHFPREFELKPGQTWERAFTEGSLFQTTVIGENTPQGVQLIGHTDFGEEQFENFANAPGTLGNLVRNIYHEYGHIQNGYASMGRMEWHEDEFRATYMALSNNSLPAYSYLYGKAYTKNAEGYFNMTPNQIKTQILGMYNSLVQSIKPAYGLPAVANPSQLPTPTKVKGRDGKVHLEY
jgi:RHS repeat-associated protein